MTAAETEPGAPEHGRLPATLTPEEGAALRVAAAASEPHGRRLVARRTLARLLGPLAQAGRAAGLDRSAIQAVQRLLLRTMATTGAACGAWDEARWLAAARTAGLLAPNVLAIAYLLGQCSGAAALAAGVQPTWFARRVFGPATVDREVERVLSYLRTVGYGRGAVTKRAVPHVLARLFIVVGQPRLEALTLELLATAHTEAPAGSGTRQAYFRLARALHGLGLLPRPLPPRPAYAHPRYAGIDPAWAAWCDRWRATATLAPATIQYIYYAALKAGRWLAAEHPTVRAPADWTRDLALAFVAAVNRMAVGDLSAPGASHARRAGVPLAPASKARLVGGLRVFFGDCQEWGWTPRRFDPRRVFATPRAVKAALGPRPRVIADDAWAKLLWAGLTLANGDLAALGGVRGTPPAGRMHPLPLVKALALVWLFAGLRSDEIVRLRVGCVRWQRHDGGPAAAPDAAAGATCLLDIPTHKTGTSYTKPVDPVVGRAIQTWEAARPPQPLHQDRKTGELVTPLFCWRGRPLPTDYLNRSLIPLLCRKGGVPLADARGRITSHRARATIASQLYNAKEPMTLFELQAWLGHHSPASTQYYARITPTTLARAYADAEYFGRNVRTIAVLLDRDAAASGAAASGTPWQYYDLGHGYCTYSFFEQCPHRMACARCDFYLPKASSRGLLLEAQGNLQRMLACIPLTDDERAAVEDGQAALDQLLARLTDVPTPAGPTPRHLTGRELPVVTGHARQEDR